MDSVREKEEQEGKTAAMVGVFVLSEREKNQDAVVYPPILFIFAANIEVFIFFAKSIIMRFFQVLAFSSLCMLALFGAVSCDDTSSEPKALPSIAEISPKGGEFTTKIVQAEGGKNRANWDYQRIYTAYAEVNVQTETAVKIDTLADGRVKYSGEWYTFYVSKDKREIKAVLTANKTNKQRSVTFIGEHQAKAAIFDFGVYQKPDTTATK